MGGSACGPPERTVLFLNFYESSVRVRTGIACCYAQFRVLLSWELSKYLKNYDVFNRQKFSKYQDFAAKLTYCL